MINHSVCIHYNGFIVNDRCGAGVDYETFRPNETTPLLQCIPCRIRIGLTSVIPLSVVEACRVVCPHFRLPSKAKVAKEQAAFREQMKKTMEVLPVIAELKDKNPNGWEGWIECPICGKRMRVSIAKGNLHARVVCETKECVSFME